MALYIRDTSSRSSKEKRREINEINEMTNDCRRPARAKNRQQVTGTMCRSKHRRIIKIKVFGYINGAAVATVCKQVRAA